MFQPPSPFPNTPLGGLAIQAIQRMLQSTVYSATVMHYQAQLLDSGSYSDRGKPSYLAEDPGVFGSGVQYVPNPDNPLRGVFCPVKRTPYQDVGGIYYQAQAELYLATNPGEIYKLDDKYPKRQDRFDVLGQTYYAVGPAFPCSLGDAIAAWKIELNLERYPVR